MEWFTLAGRSRLEAGVPHWRHAGISWDRSPSRQLRFDQARLSMIRRVYSAEAAWVSLSGGLRTWWTDSATWRVASEHFTIISKFRGLFLRLAPGRTNGLRLGAFRAHSYFHFWRTFGFFAALAH